MAPAHGRQPRYRLFIECLVEGREILGIHPASDPDEPELATVSAHKRITAHEPMALTAESGIDRYAFRFE